MQCTLNVILTIANFESAHEKAKAEERRRRKSIREIVQCERIVSELSNSISSRIVAGIEEGEF